MRKFSLFLALFLCVYVNCWGFTWVGETISTEAGKSYYLYNVNSHLFLNCSTAVSSTPTTLWTFSLNESKYTITDGNGNYIWADVGKNGTRYKDAHAYSQGSASGGGASQDLRYTFSDGKYQFYHNRNISSNSYGAAFVSVDNSALSAVGWGLNNDNPSTTDAKTYWIVLSVEKYTLYTTIDNYEAAVAAAPEASDYPHITDALSTALTTARNYSFNESTPVATVRAAITELNTAIANADTYCLAQIEANELDGWSKQSTSLANPSNYYYAILNAAPGYNYRIVAATSGNEIHYQNVADPSNDLYKTWIIEPSTNGSYSGAYVLRSLNNVDNVAYSAQDDTWGPYNLVISTDSHTNDVANAAYNLVFSDNKWQIQNAISTSHYWGAWDDAKYTEDERLAGNSGGNSNEAGKFYIYSIPKADYEAKYMANNSDLNHIIRNRGFLFDATADEASYWTGATNSNDDTSKKNHYVKGSGNGNFTETFAEMWVSNGTLNKGDVFQTIKLPAGTYKLSADIISRDLESQLYAAYGSTLNVDSFNYAYSNGTTKKNAKLLFTITTGENESYKNVKVGYKHSNTTTNKEYWSAVDNFALTKAAKLNLTITSNLGTDAIFVDDEKTSAFTFAYNDNDFTPSAPTLGSSSSNFYYTITTNTISSITDGSNDVITYDPATNKITAVNAGTATITFHQNLTSTINAYEVSYNVTVNKIPNPITVTLGGEERNSKNITFNTNVSFTYSAVNGTVTITKRDGGAGATTLANDNSKFTSAETEGIDYWDLSIAENYKYEGSSTFVRIQVNEIPEEESYLYTYLIDGSEYEIQSDGSIVINLDYSPLEIRYQAKRNNAFSSVNAVCTAYNAEDGQVYSKSEGLNTGYETKTHALPETTRKVVLSRSGFLGTPFVKEIYVVRRTYVNATADKANLGEVLVDNTETATITVDWGTSNGGNITVGSSNGHFTVSSSSIAVTDNSNGTANITVTYTPVAGTLGTEQAVITLHDRYHTATVNLQATAINNKTLVNGYGFMYNSSHKIKIDDTGTKVYEARYTSETHTVTLHELGPVSSNLIIPAGKVVLLYKAADIAKESSTIHYEYSTADNALVLPVSEDNCFKRVSYSANVVNYVLAKKNGEVAFYRYTGEETNLNVLQLPNESGLQAPSMIRIVTEDNTATALVPIYEENSAAAGQKANSKKIFIDGHLYIQQGNNLYDALGRKVQ